MLARLDAVTEKAIQAQSDIAAHEAICAERYGAILSEHKRLASRMNYVLFGIAVTCGFDLFGHSDAYIILVRLFTAMLR